MIANHMNDLREALFNLTYIIFSIFVSVLFWLKDKNKGFKHIAVSAHSVLLLLLLGLALVLGFNGVTHKLMLFPFYALLLVSVSSVICSFKYFTGSKWCHFAHFWNLAALPWTWFVGSMAVTGDWL